MNPHRQAKNQQLTRLAGEVTAGVIVELGAYRGEGTAALLRGARVPVYAVDDYRPKQGWAGEAYQESDRRVFETRLASSGYTVRLIVGNVVEVAWTWQGDIGLLVWDLGLDRLAGDFAAWQQFVTGRIAVHDTAADLFTRNFNPAGWRKRKEGVFWLFQHEP